MMVLNVSRSALVCVCSRHRADLGPLSWLSGQSRKCPSNSYKIEVQMRLQVHLLWPDVATLTRASWRILLIGSMPDFIGMWSAASLQPDIGPLSECQSARCWADDGCDRYLVGKLKSDRCRHFCRLPGGPKAGLIGIWSACRYRPAEGPAGTPRSDRYPIGPISAAAIGLMCFATCCHHRADIRPMSTCLLDCCRALVQNFHHWWCGSSVKLQSIYLLWIFLCISLNRSKRVFRVNDALLEQTMRSLSLHSLELPSFANLSTRLLSRVPQCDDGTQRKSTAVPLKDRKWTMCLISQLSAPLTFKLRFSVHTKRVLSWHTAEQFEIWNGNLKPSVSLSTLLQRLNNLS